MNIKALITTLVIGSSSIALADPSWQGGVQVDNDGDFDAGVVIRDHRGYEPAPIPATVPSYRPQPIYTTPVVQTQPRVYCDQDGDDCISDPAPVRSFEQLVSWARLTDNGGHRAIVNIGRQMGSFCKLKLDVRGSMYVSGIYVQFANGRRQFQMFPKEVLNAENPSIVVDLGSASPISRVVVYGFNGTRRAHFSISGI